MILQLKIFATAFFSVLLLDAVWLGVIAKKFNMEQLAPIGRFKPTGEFDPLYLPALLVYLLLAAAATFYVYPRFSPGTTLGQACGIGAGLGFVVYGVYEMTNLAVLKSYPLAFALVDMAWGAVLFALVALILRLLFPA